jgi:hypothetical protein
MRANRNRVIMAWMHSSDLVQRLVVGFYEYGSDSSVVIRDGTFVTS